MTKSHRSKGKPLRVNLASAGPSPPGAPESPAAWVERLERSVRACRSSSVRLPKARVVKLCLLLRIIVKFVESVDLENIEQARLHLSAFIETLPEQEAQANSAQEPKPVEAVA